MLTLTVFPGPAPLKPSFLPLVFAQGFVRTLFCRPHLPWMVPDEFFQRYAPETLPLPVRGDVPRVGGDPKKPAASDDSRRAALRAYFACISFMDRQLGRLLDTMDRLKLWDSTIVVMLGYNGYHLVLQRLTSFPTSHP